MCILLYNYMYMCENDLLVTFDVMYWNKLVMVSLLDDLGFWEITVYIWEYSTVVFVYVYMYVYE